MLTVDQQLRYARHIALEGFGFQAQQTLLKSSVLLVGAGGLGSPATIYLAAAGIGRIGIIDDDVVDLSNLQRQIIHRTCDTGVTKVESAERAILDCNPGIQVDTFDERFTESNARELVGSYDLVIDGADNFPTRYLINDAAYLEKRPVVHGSIYHFEGQAAVFNPPAGPCYRCIFPDPPKPGTVPSCAEAGVLGVLPGIIGVVEATEAIKILTGIGEPLIGRLLTYDALEMRFRTLKINRSTRCPLCGDDPTITEAKTIEWACDVGDLNVPQMTVDAYTQLRQSDEKHFLLDVREAHEIEAGNIAGHHHIPLRQLEERIGELAAHKDDLVVCQCQSGWRSQKAAEFLRNNGFTKAVNLSGGYLAWLQSIHNKTTTEPPH
ncbi:MAG: molybdopterin-synthase adenylyltransferase MoeB [Kiritimatiellia bacterium]|jgi:adenylyltransferase/sulfurtransferase|nr:molybdopterin-synthase adenylyltransferase MoeB [Kiritimatiellia bacterium]